MASWRSLQNQSDNQEGAEIMVEHAMIPGANEVRIPSLQEKRGLTLYAPFANGLRISRDRYLAHWKAVSTLPQ